MKASLLRLLERSIDYAGPFPPASLPVGDALERYLRLFDEPPAELVRRFCCPVAMLPELFDRLCGARPPHHVAVSVIGTNAAGREQWDLARVTDAHALNDFQHKCEGFAEIAAYEVRLPDLADAETYYDELKGFDSVSVYAELPATQGLEEAISAASEDDWLSLKLRVGPSVSANSLAEFIWHCASLEVPFKLTAGLHEPLAKKGHHGFMNVFTAVALAFADDFGPAQLAAVLSCEKPESWAFEPESFSWEGNPGNLEQIEDSRVVFEGFGSCSVDEPWDGLLALGWV